MTENTDFSGRAVYVLCKEPANAGVLVNVSIRRLDQRAFVVGELADDGTGWDNRAGATFWFPLDDVIMLTEYADARTAYAAYKALQEKVAAEASSQGKRVPETPQKPGWRLW